MHILVLTQNDIASPRYGGSLRVAALVEQLIRRGIKVSAVRFRLAHDRPSAPLDGVAIRDVAVPSGYALAPLAALTHTVSRAAERHAQALHRRAPIDLVQSDPPWAALSGARIARRLGVPHLVLAQNCETALAAQFAESGPASRVPLIGRRVAGFNVAVVRWAERRALGRASLTLTPSAHDLEELAACGIARARVGILPNGTSMGQQPAATRAQWRDRLGLGDAPTAVFVGRMDYPPNLAAVRVICERIAPRCPEVVFLLVGLNPPDIATPANVRMIGAVPSVAGYLRAADLALAPIRQGSGTRIKILDAWAAGLPVLATSAGASGLDYQDGVNIAIEDDFERYADRIRDLTGDPTLLARLGRGALEAVAPYRWETIGSRYVEALEALVREG